MFTLTNIIHVLFPVISLVLLIYGIKSKQTIYVTGALWLSIIALVLHYQISGGEILGSYFDYINATVYSVNLILMMICLIYLLSLNKIQNFGLRLLSSLFKAVLVIGSIIVIVNLWINAVFVGSRMAGTPIIQVANLNSESFCSYKYIFYKVGKDGSVQYLCPNKYGLIPGIGKINIMPEYIIKHLSKPVLQSILQQQQDKKKQ